MYKSCAKCGKIHDTRYKCRVGVDTYSYYNSDEYKLRNTHSWHKKSEEIKEASRYLCAMCEQDNVFNYEKLEVHHIIPLREDKTKLLDNFNLICLCDSHHKKADRGEISRDLLFELAKKRENKQ